MTKIKCWCPVCCNLIKVKELEFIPSQKGKRNLQLLIKLKCGHSRLFQFKDVAL